MKLPFSFKSTETSSSWPSSSSSSCGNPKALSLGAVNDIYGTINSAYHVDVTSTIGVADPTESWTLKSSTEDAKKEAVIRGLRSERLFFEPGETRSIMEKAKEEGNNIVLKEMMSSSLVMEMESEDPYLDFKKSMEEMAEAHGGRFKEWECLEELLSCYLRLNAKSNHAYILHAFLHH